MPKHIRLTNKQKVDIINGYQNNLTPMIELAGRYGITRQGVWKILHRAGVSTPKTSQLTVSCTTCSKPVARTRARVRRQKWHFCSQACYLAFLRANTYQPNRQGQRQGREKAGEHYALQPDNVVHHENGNCCDNRLVNLRVFACQGDHVRYHRGFDVIPIWDGSQEPVSALNP